MRSGRAPAAKLPTAEALARSRALVLLILGAYLWVNATQCSWTTLRTAALLGGSWLGYAVNERLGRAAFWITVALANPLGVAVLQNVLGLPLYGLWIFAGQDAWVALGLFYGFSRLLGLGGPMPLVFSGAVAGRCGP